MTRAACVLALAGLAAGMVGRAQTEPQVVRATTAGVLIDVTVLDNKGQPVTDLTAEDFELKEEGKLQRLLSVTLVQDGVAATNAAAAGGGATQAAAPGAAAVPAGAAATATDTRPTITAILFDRLTAEARPLAGRAAQAYVATLTGRRDYVGLFASDVALVKVQPFTANPDLLREGVTRLTGVATAPSAEQLGGQRSPRMDPNRAPTQGAESSGGFTNAADREKMLNQSAPEGIFAKMELRMEEGYRQFVAEYEGHASIAGLRAVVDALAEQPGRKSILYFNENLPITGNVKSKFEELIGRANRANVTIYAVDAAGLRVHSKEAELNRNLEVAGAQGTGDASRGEGPYTKELERQDQLLSSRPTAVLGRLTKETGGFLIENTNNLAAGVARMQQDRTTYYLLGYQPANPATDGKFRKVSVKVKRSKMTVRARPGYLAIPLPSTTVTY